MMLAPNPVGSRVGLPKESRHEAPRTGRRGSQRPGRGLALAPALSAEDNYGHGWIRRVEPGVTVQRATEVGSEEAVPNLPFLPGDRVWTDGTGRAEFQFPGRTVVRLDQRSKLDYAGHDEEGGRGVVLRLWSGSVMSTRAGATSPGSRSRPRRAWPRRSTGRRTASTCRRRGAPHRVRGRGRPRRRQAPRAGGRGRAQTWAQWGERAGGARSRSTATRATSSPPGTTSGRSQEARAATDSERYLPERARRLRGRASSSNGQWPTRPTDGYVWLPSGRRRLAALLERQLDLDALRLDLGRRTSAGAGRPTTTAAGTSGPRSAGTGSRATPGARPG